ncbi:MAG: precorrin-6y C5,15-methyltransferase (decarboxylating) subunit CbiE [Deltaproteobacteria bacterium]|nr:precorrin-6y C5,15-methyltransferase (decarboxylating) subunit CbiE [Deltaproteobacteria bacterium]
MKGRLTIIGCGMGPADLTAGMKKIIQEAEVLAGGRRHLSWFPNFKGQKEVVGAGVRELVPRLIEISRKQKVVVLTSGDPLFFGIGRLFAEQLPAEQLTIIPNVTAAQVACSRLGLPWDQNRFFSVHGREQRLPWLEILQSKQAVIYADSVRSPAVIARELVAFWPAAVDREAVLVADLGGEAEQLQRGSLAEISRASSSGLSMLVLLPAENCISPSLSLGRPDTDYEHEGGLITSGEVRAIVLSKLRLVSGVMWDVGAGSGSVGIEAAGFCSGLEVYAIEKDEQRCRQISANAETFGCTSLQVISGSVLDVMDRIPDPDRVFVGGGGKDIAEICQHTFSRLAPGGVMIAAAVTLETRAALATLLSEYADEVVEISVSRAKKLGDYRLLAAENSVCLYSFHKPLAKAL